MTESKIISVIGASNVRQGHELYETAFSLGEVLANNNFVVASGGYDGTMEALSRGANEAGGSVIGVTCETVEEKFKKVKNKWLTEEIRTKNLQERIFKIIDIADYILVLSGGVGTLGEVGMAWTLMQVKEVSRKPLIFWRKEWKSVIENFNLELGEFIHDDVRDIPVFVNDVNILLKNLK